MQSHICENLEHGWMKVQMKLNGLKSARLRDKPSLRVVRIT